MAAITVGGSWKTLGIATIQLPLLPRLSFFSIHRISSLRLRHETLSSPKLPIPWNLHALPAARSFNSYSEEGVTQKKVVTVDKKKKKKKTVEEPRYSKAARRFYNERFREQPQRLAKVLAAAGVASRRSSEELIFQGKVTVNGSVCDKPQTRVDPARDIIYVNGNRLPKKLPPKVYLALNKPKGYICSSGEKESKSILCLCDDFLKSWGKNNPGEPKPRLFTVGRLDVATTGLIIVTNDGDFAQRVSHPSSNLTKDGIGSFLSILAVANRGVGFCEVSECLPLQPEKINFVVIGRDWERFKPRESLYIAAVNGEVHKRHMVAINQGTSIDGVHCTPEYVELLPRQPDIPRARIRIVVNEGRNHEVRELVKNAGLEIHSLKRVRIGGFRLSSDLGLGKYAELKENDLKALGQEK